MQNQRIRVSLQAARAAAAVGLAVVVAGCGNLSTVTPEGTTEQPVFPDVSQAGVNDGSWPNLDNLRSVRAGMNKTQLYALLGTPHFSEGLMGVREWDYLFPSAVQERAGSVPVQGAVRSGPCGEYVPVETRQLRGGGRRGSRLSVVGLLAGQRPRKLRVFIGTMSDNRLPRDRQEAT
ncbi:MULTISPECIES: outer membrane protein assembly factor BamE [Burkholderia]|jgi:outer membrane protein assembly factor BamE (lipoprotein component of BamABCDE complex)|nr:MULTISPECIES: outer membrane protein assembly factor BamE [Burkholderia]MCA8045434.1 outer membrane protein assembly factor BamE [Burkholderia arboris]